MACGNRNALQLGDIAFSLYMLEVIELLANYDRYVTKLLTLPVILNLRYQIVSFAPI
jgi:hypothetical protein